MPDLRPAHMQLRPARSDLQGPRLHLLGAASDLRPANADLKGPLVPLRSRHAGPGFKPAASSGMLGAIPRTPAPRP